MKRIFDLILAIFLFFLLPIPLLLTAILVITTSKGLALFNQDDLISQSFWFDVKILWMTFLK